MSVLLPDDLEPWEQMKERLNDELRDIPLDIENPPNPKEEDKKPDEPDRMVWTVGFNRDMDSNPQGKNSISLLNAIKKWEMELPNMCAQPPSLCTPSPDRS